MTDYSYVGSGKVYLRQVGAAAGLMEVGNCSALAIAISEDVKKLKDSTAPGGGTANEVRRIAAVEVSMTLHNLSPENLARATYGQVDVVEAGPVIDETQTAYVGALVKTDFLSTAITSVKEGAVVLVEGTDYDVVPGGILILAGGALSDGDTVLISYTKGAADVVQALTQAGKEYEMFFAGLNEARSGKAANVEAFRVKIGAAQSLSLIGEDFAALEVTGEILKDASRTGAGESQYFVKRLQR